jgi:hypothetical protein
LLCIAIGTLGKGFDEVMPHNDNEFLVKTIENVEEKLHFLNRMVCGKSLDTATLKWSVVLENRISILSLDTFH